MDHICPVCHTNNNDLAIDFEVKEFVCSYCENLIEVGKSTPKKHIKKPVENVALEIGDKGEIFGTEYWVISIVIKKYGSDTFWREYVLKDKDGNDAFLSESDGHWVFLHQLDTAFKESKFHAEFEGRKYRWYETTPCTTYAATGFFEDKIEFGLTTYKEYVNGTEMISIEQSGNIAQYFKGNHISRTEIKKAFDVKALPYRSGVGIVQPFPYNVRQCINIMSITALLICLLQLYVVTSRSNHTIFEETINFVDVNDKEMVSKSFNLSGGSAPLKINTFSAVDNSWASVIISLVNEKTNEVTYASKDIEKYSGFEDGESWTEGSQNETFNICGVPPGNYHFLVSAEKEGGIIDPFKSGYRPQNGNFSVIQNETGTYFLQNDKDKTIVTYPEKDALEKKYRQEQVYRITCRKLKNLILF
ncbi:DUF4178 domain-containing protein [Chryseobacterium indologenes]|uniref:DUF4178 domain-containing protein n=1 Tax=Chryseobacterium indologenes TaxID=253 RepID=UPI0003E061D8|nr:DUF4178 domain-containing protein [Chryseobacterium indologenes]QPQ53616.1 DUF4178 domain-containing protein [Chryseobacterium indologenes]GAE63956.1 hypothetical protein CIN01S_04_05640 [Chryseobacterium indologenes NBRC 14944]SFJ50988.1 protein of unknown function [Chryseobacterium indologenes]SUX52493.1 Uncharacterised protein [Chryseobacterium indologenes]